jgi:hypothetical protein
MPLAASDFTDVQAAIAELPPPAPLGSTCAVEPSRESVRASSRGIWTDEPERDPAVESPGHRRIVARRRKYQDFVADRHRNRRKRLVLNGWERCG